eukprot:scaffold40875_cov14-Prasinocladus_malaysianus.AAC.1
MNNHAGIFVSATGDTINDRCHRPHRLTDWPAPALYSIRIGDYGMSIQSASKDETRFETPRINLQQFQMNQATNAQKHLTVMCHGECAGVARRVANTGFWLVLVLLQPRIPSVQLHPSIRSTCPTVQLRIQRALRVHTDRGAPMSTSTTSSSSSINLTIPNCTE